MASVKIHFIFFPPIFITSKNSITGTKGRVSNIQLRTSVNFTYSKLLIFYECVSIQNQIINFDRWKIIYTFKKIRKLIHN